MALLPLLLDEIYDLDDIYDQHFGLRDLDYLDLVLPTINVPSVKTDDKEFTVMLDVNHFKPEELKVRVESGYVVVEGQHEERSDEHGFISRQFTRRYMLPDDVLPDTLACSLSSDGVLTLQAAKKPKETSAGREIDIVRTNKPALGRRRSRSRRKRTPRTPISMTA